MESGPLWEDLYSKQINKGKNYNHHLFIGSSKEEEKWIKKF